MIKSPFEKRKVSLNASNTDFNTTHSSISKNQRNVFEALITRHSFNNQSISSASALNMSFYNQQYDVRANVNTRNISQIQTALQPG